MLKCILIGICIAWFNGQFIIIIVQYKEMHLILELLLLRMSSGVVWQCRDLQLSRSSLYLLSHRICFSMVLKCDVCVYRDDSLPSRRIFMRTKQPTKCFVPLQKLSLKLGPENMFSSPLHLFITDRFKTVVLLWFSVACFWCQSLCDVSPYVCSCYCWFG